MPWPDPQMSRHALGFHVAAGTEIHLRLVGNREIVRIEPRGGDRGAEIVAVHAGKQVGVDDVVRGVLRQRGLVGFVGIGFLRCDEAGAHIGEVGAQRQRGGDAKTVADCARQQDRAVEPLLDFAHQRERRERAGMAAGAGAHQDQSVDALLRRLARMLDVDDVVEHQPAIGVRGLDDLGGRSQRSDDDGRPVLHTGFHVLHQPVVGGVADLVDRIGRDLLAGIARFVFAELVPDAAQPLVELVHRTGVERRKRADDTGLALGDHQLRAGNDEERRADDGQLQIVLEQSGQCHPILLTTRVNGLPAGGERFHVDCRAGGVSAAQRFDPTIGLDGGQRIVQY
ncbi:hypothetical protein ABIG04_002399 [Bradyrhizobium japonicum]